MAQENINIGSSPNDGTGDTLRQGAIKINNNFDELFTKTEIISNSSIPGSAALSINEPLPLTTGIRVSKLDFTVGNELVGIVGVAVAEPFRQMVLTTQGGTGSMSFNLDDVPVLRLQSNRTVSLVSDAGGGGNTYLLNLPNEASDAGGRGRANSWDTYSDERIKSNREPLVYGIDTIMQLNPYNYFHHNSTFDEDGKLKILEAGEETIGLVAQEVAQVIPEVVSTPEDLSNDLCSLDYSKLTTVLIKAIQEQQTIIESLSARLDNANL